MKQRVSLLSAALAMAFAAQGQIARPAPKSVKPANEWMKIPTDLSVRDLVPRSMRYARDEFFDAAAISREPLTAESAQSIHASSGIAIKGQPEIEETPDRAVVIGAFVAARSVLTGSGRAIYTEMTFRLSDVFEDVSGHAAPSSDITIIVPGGTVKTTDGRVISYLTQPLKYFLQPEKTYLLVLQYQRGGDFYTRSGTWDLSDRTEVLAEPVVISPIPPLNLTKLWADSAMAATTKTIPSIVVVFFTISPFFDRYQGCIF